MPKYSFIQNIPVVYEQEFSCDYRNIGGIKQVWFTSRSKLGRWRYEETAPYIYGKVIDNSFPTNWFSLAKAQYRTARFDTTFNEKPVKRYNTNLTVEIYLMDYIKRDFITRLILKNDICLIVRDNDDKYWLLGEQVGCRVTYSGTTDQYGGTNRFVLSFDDVNTNMVRAIDSTFVEQYVNQRTFDQYDLAELDVLNLAELTVLNL